MGRLAEMRPDGMVGVSEVCVLGLNTNFGQVIHLRLRIDDLSGFRKLLNIRHVLYHELAHNERSEHDGEFNRIVRQVTPPLIFHDTINACVYSSFYLL